jgi:hypothetical protein
VITSQRSGSGLVQRYLYLVRAVVLLATHPAVVQCTDDHAAIRWPCALVTHRVGTSGWRACCATKARSAPGICATCSASTVAAHQTCQHCHVAVQCILSRPRVDSVGVTRQVVLCAAVCEQQGQLADMVRCVQ